MFKSRKKVYNSWHRDYRNLCQSSENEKSFQLLVQESDIRILTSEQDPSLNSKMLETLHNLRADIKAWIALHPQFRTSLTPLKLEVQAPEIIKRMYLGAQKAKVGPFAAVAGTIAQMLAKAHVCPNLIVENGGDIYMYSEKDRVVALLADPKSSASIGLRFTVKDFPLALCASSATIGHSLSFGQGELAVVHSKDAALADAMATALGNKLKNANAVQSALDFGKNIQGIEGIFLQCGESIGIWGNMELVVL